MHLLSLSIFCEKLKTLPLKIFLVEGNPGVQKFSSPLSLPKVFLVELKNYSNFSWR
jgi:hypothetical protein